jgi:hypothetical protein
MVYDDDVRFEKDDFFAKVALSLVRAGADPRINHTMVWDPIASISVID